MKKLKQQFGITSFLQYGGGKGVYNPTNTDFEERIFGFKLHRHFVDNRRYVQGGGDPGFNPDSKNILQVQRTPQGWHTDDYLQLLKDNGIESMWTLQGKFPWQDTIGKATKVMPIMEADYVNQGDPIVWQDLAKFAGQLAIRYASDTSEFLDQAIVYQNPSDFRNNTPKAGMGLLNIIQVLNEPNFNKSWSGATNTLTPEGTAAAYVAVYNEVRKYSNTMRLVSGPPIGIADDKEFLDRMLSHMQILFGGTIPSDVEISFHWYMREGNQSQSKSGNDTGASPEFVKAHELGQYVNDLCKQYGIAGWWCTETGWAASSTIDKSKNACPIQEGFTQLESQGILYKRLMLIWASLDKHIGTTFWHCRDDYDTGGYAKGGVCLNDSNWTPKPVRDICYDFLNKYSEYSVNKYYTLDGGNSHYAELVNEDSGDIITLGWSDRTNYNNLTPDPKIVTNIVVPNPTGSTEPTSSTQYPDITSIKLVDIFSGSELDLSETSFINTSILPTFSSISTVVVQIENADSVEFKLSGSGFDNYVRTEKSAPYALFGDTSGKLNGNVLYGSNILSVRPYNSSDIGEYKTYNIIFTTSSQEPTGSIPTGSTEPTSSTGNEFVINLNEIESLTLSYTIGGVENKLKFII
jgi:hypothetical protein